MLRNYITFWILHIGNARLFRLSIVNKLLALIVLLWVPTSVASVISIDWEDIGGSDTFGRQAVSFEPMKIDSFVGFYSDGLFTNLIDTEHSLLEAEIYLKIGDSWLLFAEDANIKGLHGSSFALHNFTFYDLDFSQGLLGGINITNSGAGASQYVGMNSYGSGTHFTFDIISVPEPTTLFLMGAGVLVLFRFNRSLNVSSNEN